MTDASDKKAVLRKKRTAPWRTTEAKPSKLLPDRPRNAIKGITNAAFEDALRKSGGMLGDTARLLGIRRQTVHDRLKRSPALQAVHAEVRDDILDLAETKLVEAIRAGNLGAACFFLKTQGRARGYVERNELTTVEGEPIRFYLPKKAELPPDDEPLATIPATPGATPAG